MKRKCWMCEETKECLHKVYVRGGEGQIVCHPLCKQCKQKLDEMNQYIDFRGN